MLRASVSSLAHLASKTSLEILVDSSRPDDREIAERVVVALDKLGLTATVAPVAAPELARRLDTGACDLYIAILGRRYGFVPDGEDDPNAKSITEIEYEMDLRGVRTALRLE